MIVLSAAGLVVAYLVSVLSTPAVIRWAEERRILDDPQGQERKIHARPTPRLGGVVIVLAFALAQLLLYATRGHIRGVDVAAFRPELLSCALLIAATGAWDDLRGATARLRLLVQLLAALLAWNLGFRIEVIDLPFLPPTPLGWFALPLTVLWIVGVTNAVNLIDGLDGLAAGIALVGLLPVALRAFIVGDPGLAFTTSALAGALAGFIRYNRHPARIFMGDAGSTFIGFVLSVVTVQSAQKGPAAVSMLVPVLALGVPILDTLTTVARRMYAGRPLFEADRGHLHHRLLDAGHSHRGAVVVLYAAACCFAAGALVIQLGRYPGQGLALAVSSLGAALVLRRLTSGRGGGRSAPP